MPCNAAFWRRSRPPTSRPAIAPSPSWRARWTARPPPRRPPASRRARERDETRRNSMDAVTAIRHDSRPATGPEFDAVVIGAGVAGLYQLYRLRELGLRVRT